MGVMLGGGGGSYTPGRGDADGLKPRRDSVFGKRLSGPGVKMWKFNARGRKRRSQKLTGGASKKAEPVWAPPLQPSRGTVRRHLDCWLPLARSLARRAVGKMEAD